MILWILGGAALLMVVPVLMVYVGIGLLTLILGSWSPITVTLLVLAVTGGSLGYAIWKIRSDR